MLVSFRKCSRPQKPDPISDRNCQNLYPFSDQNGSKTIPFGAAHTYIPYIGEYPPPPPGTRSCMQTIRKHQISFTFAFTSHRLINKTTIRRNSVPSYEKLKLNSQSVHVLHKTLILVILCSRFAEDGYLTEVNAK